MLKKFFVITIISNLFISSSLAGTLSGRVNFDGKAPKKKTLRLDADPICGAAHKEPPYRQSFILNKDGYIKNVMIYLKDIKYDGKIPENHAVLDKNGCIYSPHVQGMMVGQELLIKNSEATLHNIHGLPTINSEFNFAMPKVVKEKAIKIDKPEHPIYIKCDVHPWMKAWVMVSGHPYFAITDENGYYKIDNVPPGKYEVVLGNEAVSTILVFLAVYGFNAKNKIDGMSPITIGENQFDEQITLYDNPFRDDSIGFKIDASGAAKKQKVTWY